MIGLKRLPALIAAAVLVPGVCVGCTAATPGHGTSPVAATSSTASSTATPTVANSVAVLGDSYAAGEGTYNNGNSGNAPSIDYYLSTQTWDNQSGCHRSPGAYAPLLGVASRNFVACSGATISDIENSYKGFPSQLGVLHPGIRVVILSVTGDDLGFAGVLDNCTDLPTHSRTLDQCKSALDTGLAGLPKAMDNLKDLYGRIENLTQGAHIIQVGYPDIFPDGGQEGCNWVTAEKQRLINDATNQLDQSLLLQAALDSHVTFVDTRALFDGHEVCGAVESPYINDLQTDELLAHNCPDDYLVGSACSQSYHPNSLAYAAEADMLKPLVNALLTGGSASPTPTPTSQSAAPSPSTSSPVNVTPGHASAEDAVAGFYQAELNGDWSATTGACSYVQPAAQSLCASGTQGYWAASGHFTVVGAVIQSPKALVEVTGQMTAPDGSQTSNQIPTSGMPVDPSDFNTIYNNLTNSPATVFSPAPCIEIDGKWYINAGG